MADESSTVSREDQIEYENSEPKEDDKSQAVARNNKFPLTRIKNIMKTDPDVTLASQESVFLLAKATEYFLESFTKSAYTFTERGKKKTIRKQDIDLSIDTNDAYAFLEGALEWN
ncbi:DNA polymerase epsilon subunit 4 [Strongylocentrotus purpuratus]|uniref:Transcription factor CBF/NF-Y/archaeal histone domain-containing protein n=1 Tax=Strongylocentrotus purpuratus TaxID=7668 RepID=A0A7M7PI67_STRPU|nr:DNA polymerase epsilon subunit 4 [Strongylocentrotus purpuratus]|eukprot:XP_001199906.2 PREDICTED: DNA polymerase epsilon subunit 4 [Strongylocentrotus purpuratus]